MIEDRGIGMSNIYSAPGRALRVQTALSEHWRGQPPASQHVASAESLPAW